MRRRRIVTTLVLTGVVLGTAASPAGARPADRRVVVAIVSAGTVESWTADPVLAGILRDGASAILSARTTREEDNDSARATAAIATLGAGARMPAGGEGHALAEALHEHGVPFVASPEFLRALAASVLRVVEGAVPGDLAAPAVAVIDARASTTLVARARSLLEQDDVLIVLSAIASEPTLRLGVIATLGDGPGLLRSPSTRREGVVTLADVAPSILSTLLIDIPVSMEGAPFVVRTHEDPVRAVGELDQTLRRAARARAPFTRALMVAAMILLSLGAFTAAKRRSSRILEAGLTALVSAPACALLAFAFMTDDSAGAGVAMAFALAALVGASSVWIVGIERALAAVGSGSVLLVLGDLVAGTPLASRSPLSFVIARGDRFYGIGNEYMGVVIAGTLLALVAFDERVSAARRDATRIVVAAALTAIVGVMSAPASGAKLGATLTAVPALGVFVARRDRRATNVLQLAAIAATTVAATAAVSLAARFGEASHLGTAPSGSVVSRKLEAIRGIARFSIWTDTLLVLLVVLGVLWFARKDQVRTLMRARPTIANAALASAVAMVCAVAFNDAGIVAAAIMAVMLAPGLLAALARVPRWPASRAEQPQPWRPAASN